MYITKSLTLISQETNLSLKRFATMFQTSASMYALLAVLVSAGGELAPIKWMMPVANQSSEHRFCAAYWTSQEANDSAWTGLRPDVPSVQ